MTGVAELALAKAEQALVRAVRVPSLGRGTSPSTRVLIVTWLASVSVCLSGCHSPGGSAPHTRDAKAARTERLVIGYSVEHRPIVALRIGPARATRSLLVVGSIAGDEPGGIAVIEALSSEHPINGVICWLIADMNPDGVARRTRVNADGVDLNRNFSFAWRPFAPYGNRYYPGPKALSEPESRAVAAFVGRIRPTIGIWLHQPYGLVDDSEGPLWAERLMASAAGLPLQALLDYPGSAIGWEDHLSAHSAFDVELEGKSLSRAEVSRYADAIRLVARSLASGAESPRR